MSRPKRKRKKNLKKKIAQKLAAKKAPAAVAQPATSSGPKQPVRTVHVISDDLRKHCRDFGVAVLGAIKCALNDDVESSRAFLDKSRKARNKANKLIDDRKRKIRRRPIGRIDLALIKFEREQVAKAMLEEQTKLEQDGVRRELARIRRAERNLKYKASIRTRASRTRIHRKKREAVAKIAETINDIKRMLRSGAYDLAEETLNFSTGFDDDFVTEARRQIKVGRVSNRPDGRVQHLKLRSDGWLQTYWIKPVKAKKSA